MLVLRGTPGLGDRQAGVLLQIFGSPGNVLSAPSRRLLAAGGVSVVRARGNGLVRRQAAELRWRCQADGILILTQDDPAYPDRLRHLCDAPLALFLRGDPGLLSLPCVALVGSRRATSYGRRIAGRLGQAVVKAGGCVVSGMALGIDGASHEGALPGPTIAVLGSGVDVPTPTTHRLLYDRIVATGLVCSEFDPGTPAAPFHFPRRNRIIAALAERLVVVEAAKKSGALITVDMAIDLGRDVYAVPGPIDRGTSEGTNDLLFQGAGIVLSGDNVPGMTALTESPALRVADPRKPLGGPVLPDVPSELRALADLIGDAPLGVEEIAERAGCGVSSAAMDLIRLEILGHVERSQDGRYRKVSGGHWAGKGVGQ